MGSRIITAMTLAKGTSPSSSVAEGKGEIIGFIALLYGIWFTMSFSNVSSQTLPKAVLHHGGGHAWKPSPEATERTAEPGNMQEASLATLRRMSPLHCSCQPQSSVQPGSRPAWALGAKVLNICIAPPLGSSRYFQFHYSHGTRASKWLLVRVNVSQQYWFIWS